MEIQTKTHPSVMRSVAHALGNGAIITHRKNDSNPLGQSGIHTFVSDILTIVENCEPGDEFRKLMEFCLGTK